MKKHTFYRCFLLFSILLILCFSTAFTAVSFQSIRVAREQANASLLSIKPFLSGDNAQVETYLHSAVLATPQQLYLLRKDQTLLATSEKDTEKWDTQQHPEVKKALLYGHGDYARYTDGWMQYALRLENENVLVVYTPMQNMLQNMITLLPMLIVGVIAALLFSWLVARKSSAFLSRAVDTAAEGIGQLAQGNYQHQMRVSSLPELDMLHYRINSLAQSIQQTLERLHREKDKTNYILDSMEEGIIIVDNHLDLITANSAARRFLRNTYASADEKYFEAATGVTNLIHLTHNPQIIRLTQKAIAEKNSALLDFSPLFDPSRIASIHISPVNKSWLQAEAPTGEAKGAILLITDVTQERNALAMRKEFMANASHELKTPLTSIMGFAELLSSSMIQDEEKRKEYSRRIQNEAKRMAELVEDILKISYLENQSQQPDISCFSFNQLIAEVMQDLQPQAKEKDVSVVLKNGPQVMLQAERRDIIQLATNLIENAIKYNVQGGKVDVSLCVSGPDAVFKVADTGIGVAHQHLARIFERFYRVDKGRDKKVGGTGLGLAIVKHITARYQGEVAINSIVNRGTTITVKLPLQFYRNEN